MRANAALRVAGIARLGSLKPFVACGGAVLPPARTKHEQHLYDYDVGKTHPPHLQETDRKYNGRSKMEVLDA